jgi:CheY-like chemotaxis protein
LKQFEEMEALHVADRDRIRQELSLHDRHQLILRFRIDSGVRWCFSDRPHHYAVRHLASAAIPQLIDASSCLPSLFRHRTMPAQTGQGAPQRPDWIHEIIGTRHPLQYYPDVTDKMPIQETILVVEDDVLVRMPIAQYLRDCGYKVIEAVSAGEAMAVLSHQKTVVDIVFSDIEMPGTLEGFGLAKWIREHRPGLDVLLAGTVPRAVEQAKELCENGSIPKPYEVQAVHNHIRRMLAARQARKPTK